MKRIVTLLLAVVSISAFSQLSKRENNPSTYYSGVRPEAGDLSIFLAAGLDEFEDLADVLTNAESDVDNLELSDFSLVNVKYYTSPRIAIRAGLIANKKFSNGSGDLFYEEDDEAQDGDLINFKSKTSNQEAGIKLGIERHFNTNNMLDIYGGGEILFGINSRKRIEEEQYEGGDYQFNNVKGSALTYGLGGFVGVQAFVADLPLSFGVEYGVLGKGFLGNKYKVDQSSKVGDTETTRKFLSTTDNIDDDLQYTGTDGQRFSKLLSRNYQLRNNFRLVLSYYFSK